MTTATGQLESGAGEGRELRYLPVFLTVILLIFAGICIHFYFQSVRSVNDVLRLQVEQLSSRIASRLTREYAVLIREANFLTRNNLLPKIYTDAVIAADEQDRAGRQFLQWFHKQTNKNFNYIAFMDANGQTLYASLQEAATKSNLDQVEGEDLEDSPVRVHDISRLQSTDARLHVESFLNAAEQPQLRVMAKIRFRKAAGVALAEAPMSELFDPIQDEPHLVVFNRTAGTVVYSSAQLQTIGQTISTAFPELFAAWQEMLSADSTHTVAVTIEEEQYIASLKSVQQPDWTLIAYTKTGKYVGKTEKSGQLTLLICGLFLLSCTLVIRTLILRIRKSAVALKRANELIAEQNLALSMELEKAHDMQMELMPTSNPRIEGFDIAGICRPATHVGGDFFQYFPLPDGRLVLAMADVTGHGMEAAIPTVLFSGILNNEMESETSPEAHFSRLNRSLHRTLNRRTFVCCTMGELDPVQRRIRVTNGGCPYPYHYCASTGKIEELCIDAFPLGLRAEAEYPVIQIDLSPGDFLVFCSDGIIEAQQGETEIFGFERTASIIGQASKEGVSATVLMDRLMGEVDAFTGVSEQHDDQTIVVLRVDA